MTSCPKNALVGAGFIPPVAGTHKVRPYILTRISIFLQFLNLRVVIKGLRVP